MKTTTAIISREEANVLASRRRTIHSLMSVKSSYIYPTIYRDRMRVSRRSRNQNPVVVVLKFRCRQPFLVPRHSINTIIPDTIVVVFWFILIYFLFSSTTTMLQLKYTTQQKETFSFYYSSLLLASLLLSIIISHCCIIYNNIFFIIMYYTYYTTTWMNIIILSL